MGNKGEGLSERFLNYAVRIVLFVERLEKSFVGRHIGGQLFRAGTSAGSNCEEACGAESRPDFVHKLGVVLKELREARFWLRLIQGSKLLPENDPGLLDILQETEELAKITAKSIITARQNKNKQRAS
ncbi:MAG: four helix bundle protein [Calditrichaceae bacterium]|nr:four helix bundle protein [Calditrichia bacterium]NUQ44221.1 four helix bundle protein [Calditrichaceae bacterium]